MGSSSSPKSSQANIVAYDWRVVGDWLQYCAAKAGGQGTLSNSAGLSSPLAPYHHLGP